MSSATPPEQPKNPVPAPEPAPQPAPQSPEKVQVVTRFARLQRIEHIILLLSFSMLVFTGLPQKFASAPLSQFIIDLFGGIESIRVVHRLSAIILMILSIYHVVAVLYRLIVQRVPWTMIPVVEDFKHLMHDLQFYFGRRKHKAYYGRYNYAEKAEYLAVVWGTFIMIITGFMMWNPIATTNYLPGQFIPAAKAAHGGEAVLATLAIIIWHFYHVHLRHFNKSMFIGRMTRHEMEEEHPAELALIDQGKDFQPPPPAVLRRRQKIFYPTAAVIVIVSGVLLLGFITFEKTAIETVPPVVTGEAFVPYTPTPTLPPTQTPTPTMTPTPGAGQPAAGPAWDTTISALLNAKCAACHVNAALGGLSLKTYADALKAVVPNDPDASILVQVQQAGGHAGQFTPEEIDRVIAWINNGAPETSSGGGPAPAATPIAVSAINGWADAGAIFIARCAMCHINSQAGGLSLKTYTDTLKGGNRGPAVMPGDPDNSVLVTFLQGTEHPSLGRLTPEELAPLIAWIENGAPEIASEEPPASEATPATATPSGAENQSGGSEAWIGGIDQLINAKCAGCHVAASMGNLSLKTYADALKGGAGGPAVVPNEPDNSTLVTVQQEGGHPGQFTAEEIDRIVKWIEAGAPETGGTSAPAAAPAPTGGVTTWAEASIIFTTKCAMCHINSAAGNLSLKTYAEALKGGQSGPAIVAGDPDNSPLVIVPQSTSHPALGKLLPEELAALIAWIEAGAPEE
jgi:cytochrome b subunit of formate dehydrogenase/mono/diheme cytochrome c family protein